MCVYIYVYFISKQVIMRVTFPYSKFLLFKSFPSELATISDVQHVNRMKTKDNCMSFNILPEANKTNFCRNCKHFCSFLFAVAAVLIKCVSCFWLTLNYIDVTVTVRFFLALTQIGGSLFLLLLLLRSNYFVFLFIIYLILK